VFVCGLVNYFAKFIEQYYAEIASCASNKPD